MRGSFGASFGVIGLLVLGCEGYWLVPKDAPSDGDAALVSKLDPIRYDFQLPGLGAALVEAGALGSQAVVGFRALGYDAPLVVTDPFHLGSNAKAMTATVAARLAEAGLLDWEAPLADAFPDAAVDPGYDGVVVADLFTHRAGLPRDPTSADLAAVEGLASPTEQRRALAQLVLARPPAVTPLDATSYSNVGYMLAGAVIEVAAGTTFVEALTAELFEPLSMGSCGPHSPGTEGAVIDAPRGHTSSGRVQPPGLAGDLPVVYEPAGLVHCNLADWARFVEDQLRGARGEPALLQASSYARLQTPADGTDYAYGWIVVEDARSRILVHDGSNGVFSSLAVLRPDENRAWLVVTNIGGPRPGEAFPEALDVLDALAP